MEASKIEAYLDIARNTEAFNPAEIEVLKEVLEDHKNNHRTNYVFFDERADNHPLGFVIFGKIPMTDCGWDVYWLVVDKPHQGNGIGKKLLKRIDTFILEKQPKAFLRVETSSKKKYAAARNLYTKAGFTEILKITNFYNQEDDLITFYKELMPADTAASKPSGLSGNNIGRH